MTLRARLLLAGAPLFLALLVVGALAMQSIAQLGRSSQSILAQNYRSVLAAQRMKETIERIDDDAYFAATGHRERSGAVGDARATFESELRVEESNITEPGEADVARELRSQWIDYQTQLDRCLALPAGPGSLACYFDELRPRFDSLKSRADRVLALNQDAMALKGERARRDGASLRDEAWGGIW